MNAETLAPGVAFAAEADPFGGLPRGHFGALMADPPWSFKTWSGKRGTPHRCAEDHYRTMTLDQIAELPVADLAAPDCALFMWVVDSHLDEAIKLGAAWGFGYKTRAFEWVKTTAAGIPKIGMGYWTRKQTESCLLFTRGKPKRISKGVRQLIMAPRREHSRKPDETHGRVEALVAGPYLELFAREPRDGWSVWGNQTDKFEAPPLVSKLEEARRPAIVLSHALPDLFTQPAAPVQAAE